MQTAIIQSRNGPPRASGLPLKISTTVPIPKLVTCHDVLLRVLAVAGNPTDFKMPTHFYMEDNVIGCDFCGVIEQAGSSAKFPVGTRVCGADFPYRTTQVNPHNGAFAQWLVIDSRHLLRIPDDWSDLQGAALGALGWGTAGVTFGDPDALDLPGRPSKPIRSEKMIPVLVYGGATATGIVAIQLLKASGYTPVAVCSPASSERVQGYGALGTADYAAPDCAEQIKAICGGVPIKHALDCITDEISAATCFRALARMGGKYACLEEFSPEWATRRAVRVKVVMGFEMLGYDVDFGPVSYARPANPALQAIGRAWADEVQGLLDQGKMEMQPIGEIEGGFEGLLRVVDMMQRGEESGKKLVVRIPT